MALGFCLKLLLPLILAFLALKWFAYRDWHGLKIGYYNKSCPEAEHVVRRTVASFVTYNPGVAAGLLRLHFHDCFVRGCEGSVLINSTKTNKAEKDAKPNLSLRGFYVIDAAKEALERACPNIVSCSDIVALAARDAVSILVSGPGSKRNVWEVETGRRDGRKSMAAEALKYLPSPDDDINILKRNFLRVNLNATDLAILSGAHTIGTSHCSSIYHRLYNYTGKGDTDPSLDPNYASWLKRMCKPGDETTTVEMDSESSTKFDRSYYSGVAANKGLFHSDAALLKDPTTRNYVYSVIESSLQYFLIRRLRVFDGKDGKGWSSHWEGGRDQEQLCFN